jgi:Flp pilus assembly pilin Flp
MRELTVVKSPQGTIEMNQLRNILLDDDAATAVEYAVMLGLILMVAISGISAFGAGNNGLWGGILTSWNQFIGN